MDAGEQRVEQTAEGLWHEVAARLRGSLNETTYGTWFGEARGVSLESGGSFVLGVPNDFTRNWIEGHFLSLIGAAIRDITGHERPIELRVVGDGAPVEAPSLLDELHEQTRPKAAVVERLPSRPESGGFNAKYTFDSFVIGSSNRFAHAAALAVAEAPAQAYNPLFIYGGTGLGKTHLLQAVAQYVSEHTGALSVRYVTSETFMNDLINSLRDKSIEGFKQR
jgi:chromosomal replication initiator protein